MENQQNNFIAVAYRLSSVENNEYTFIEEAVADSPFTFISGFGFALEAFEEAVKNLAQGEKFDFTLTPDEAYGSHEAERVLDLDRELFTINGHFDHDTVKVGASVPLMNEDGNRFMGKVLDITDTQVKMDLNHPLAGLTLRFEGEIVENRPATDDEISALFAHDGGGCGCGGGCSCGSGESDGGSCGCHEDEYSGGGCGCGGGCSCGC